MDDLLAALTADCQGDSRCGTPHDQVAWCPAWGAWLCHGCRWRRSDRELRAVRTAAERKLLRAARIT